MGKGDIKTKRGKRSNGSYGKHRPRKVATTIAVATKASETKKKPAKKVATAKKEA